MIQKPIRKIEEAATWAEILAVRGESDTTEKWVTFYSPGKKEEAVTYGYVFDQSARIAHGLRKSGLQPGHPVLMILPTSADFLYTFFGILLAGAVPVPLYPPVRFHEMDQYAKHLRAVIKDCGSRIVVASGELSPLLKWMGRSAGRTFSIYTPERLSDPEREQWELPDCSSRDTAMIQYTSGSTGMPKGVELTHGNLLSNVRGIAEVLQYRKDDVAVIWLPLYHDMGLIGGILSTLRYAIPVILFTPLDFIRSPREWLWAIHRYRGTLSAAPNFAYSLCMRKIKDHEIDGLDLSSWRAAIHGAEPIQPEVLRNFTQRFGVYGFNPRAMTPAYGLAESSLAVTFSSPDHEPRIRSYDREALEREKQAGPVRDGQAVIHCVSVGRPIPDHRVRILDADGKELPDRSVGEVVVQGPSVMKGYYQNKELTAETLRDGWLHTGDLGFIDQRELYITGRSKDVIIKGGKNYPPQDLEASASSVLGVRPGCVAGFGVMNKKQGTEEIVLVAETRVRSSQARKDLMHEIKRRAGQELGWGPDRIVLVPPGSVAKTSSGKVQRSLCRDRYLSGQLHRSRARSLWNRLRFYVPSLWSRS